MFTSSGQVLPSASSRCSNSRYPVCYHQLLKPAKGALWRSDSSCTTAYNRRSQIQPYLLATTARDAGITSCHHQHTCKCTTTYSKHTKIPITQQTLYTRYFELATVLWASFNILVILSCIDKNQYTRVTLRTPKYSPFGRARLQHSRCTNNMPLFRGQHPSFMLSLEKYWLASSQSSVSATFELLHQNDSVLNYYRSI